jgi:predicted HTH domain antitoxin
MDAPAAVGDAEKAGAGMRYNNRAMTTLVVELPTEIDAEEARLLLAIKLYEMGRLSLGQAAQLAGYSKPAFMELLGKYGAPVFAYSPEELRAEVER